MPIGLTDWGSTKLQDEVSFRWGTDEVEDGQTARQGNLFKAETSLKQDR